MSVYENKAIFGECKWKNEKVDLSVVEPLFDRGELFYYKDKNYIIFSKAGFIDEVLEYAQNDERFLLIDFSSMCER